MAIADRSTIELDEFLRLYPARTPQLMWFLGAGASAAAGIPTADDMVWSFKRSIYCSREKVPLSRCPDLSDNRLRSRLQRYFDDQDGYPIGGAPDEYSFYFERAYPDDQDRRRFIENAVRGATPTFAHLALAALMASHKVQIVWSSNFDRCLEDAWNRLTGSSGDLYVGSLHAPEPGRDAYAGQRWPIYNKVHGDFQSSRLKNTSRELQKQDESLREMLADSCRYRGLAIVGYSGRDDSIIQTLRESLSGTSPYPAGVFWLRRSDGQLSDGALGFLAEAREKGVQAVEVLVETFDELMTSLLGMFTDLPVEYAATLDDYAPPVTDAPIPAKGRHWPVLRFNALPITSHPTVTRLADVEIGGAKEVRQAVVDSGRTDIFIRRRKEGVIGFGSDEAFKAVFNIFGIKELDLYPVESRRLRYDSPERGLLTEALAVSLTATRPLELHRRRGDYILAVRTSMGSEAALESLRNTVGAVTGKVPNLGLSWHEAILVRLETVIDRLWLVFEPLVYIDGLDQSNRLECQDFINRRVTTRYNRQSNQILDAWANIIAGSRTGATISLGVTDGVNATFTIGGLTTFSRAL